MAGKKSKWQGGVIWKGLRSLNALWMFVEVEGTWSGVSAELVRFRGGTQCLQVQVVRVELVNEGFDLG